MRSLRLSLALLMALLMLCSCATGGVQNLNHAEKLVSYPLRQDLTDSPTRVLYLENCWLRYYNKLDGETYPFCFDSLCEHTSDTCVSNLFISANQGDITYCEYDNRFYFLRGQKFCSMSFDGSDLAIEYSYGEGGSFDQWDYGSSITLSDISSYQNYVFFLWINSETGTYNLMRFNAKTSRIDNLSVNAGLEEDMGRYLLVDDGIVFLASIGDSAGLYYSDFELSSIVKISDLNGVMYISKGIYDNGYYYMTERTYENGEDGQPRMVSSALRAFSLQTSEKKTLYTDTIEPELLAVTADYIYFKKSEKVNIGYYSYPDGRMKDVNNYHSKLYRLNKITGECVVIMDSVNCQIEEICLLEKNILINGYWCIPGEGVASTEQALMIGDFDKDGMVVNLRTLSN